MTVKHTRTSIFHHCSDLLPHISLIAMCRAFRASGLIIPKRAFFKSSSDIVEKPLAFRTQVLSFAMLPMTKYVNHQLRRSGFLLHYCMIAWHNMPMQSSVRFQITSLSSRLSASLFLSAAWQDGLIQVDIPSLGRIYA